MIYLIFFKMSRIQPEELVPGMKYKIGDPNVFFKFTEFYKIGTFIRVAYRLNGVWYYLFHVEGKRRFFASDRMFYKFVPENTEEKMDVR
jgi:hypothetical protein